MNIDLNNAVIAVTLLGTAVRALLTGRKIRKVHGTVEDVHDEVKNGAEAEHRSLRDVVVSAERTTKSIDAHHAYQRIRNHDLMAGVGMLLARQYLMMLELTPDLAHDLGPPSLDQFASDRERVSQTQQEEPPNGTTPHNRKAEGGRPPKSQEGPLSP